MTTDTVGPQLLDMLNIAAASLDPPVERELLVPGIDVAWDDCCSGQVWVRLQGMVPYSATKIGGQPCSRKWLATVGIGVLRCVSTLDESGAAYPASVLTNEALDLYQDQAALAEAIQCRMTGVVSVESWLPLGAEGGCAGGEWTILVPVHSFGCPEPP